MSSLSKYGTNMALRLVSRWSGKKLISGESADQVGEAAAQVGTAQVLTGGLSAREGEAFTVQSDGAPIAVNDDVWRRRFFRRRGLTKFRRAWRLVRRGWRWVAAFVGDLRSPKFSADEKFYMLSHFSRMPEDDLEERRRAKQDAALFQLHKDQARLIGRTMIEVLTNLGFCYSITKNEQRHIKKRVRFVRVDVTPYSYTYHVHPVLPFGVKRVEMAQDAISTEIAASIGKKVRHELDLNGLRYIVEVGSTLSVPNFVEFKDVSAMPKNMPALAFFAGLSANGSPIYRNLVEAPHMIIAGSSGGGKSNMENAIACTYLMRNTADRVRFVFFDLKGGVEFSHYEGIPHLWPLSNEKGWKSDGIIERPEDVIAALDALFVECNTRLAKLKAAKKKNVNEYNRGKHPKNRMALIVVFFDEWATTKKLVGDKAETILSNIANLSRSAGIHFILSTQYPKAEIINTAISVNFPWRIAFNMSSGASQSVLGGWEAYGLSPTGRAILQTNEGNITVQTPRITNSTVAAIVSAVRSGGAVAEMASVDAEEILEWALNNTGGKLDRDTLFGAFKEKITVAALNDLLKSMEGQTFEVQGTLYNVAEPRGRASRRMELADGETRQADDENDKQQTTTEE